MDLKVIFLPLHLRRRVVQSGQRYPPLLGSPDFPPQRVSAPSLRRLRMCGGHSCAPWPTQKQTCCAISRCCFLRTGRKLYMRDSFRLRYPAGSFCSARACHSWHSLTTASFACWASVAENGEAAPMLCACAVAGWRRGTTQGGRGGSPEPGWWWKREVQFWRS